MRGAYRSLVGLLIVGLPIALVIAWFVPVVAPFFSESPVEIQSDLSAQVDNTTRSEQSSGNRKTVAASSALDFPIPTMVRIPAGTFVMGSRIGYREGFRDETPAHKVTIQPFFMSKNEVTFAEYDAFANDTDRPLLDDAGWGRGSRPVINVSWDDALAYIKWLNAKNPESTYRLPTEAEWEYAARAKSETRYWWGHDIGINNANCDKCGSEWSNKQTAPVGSFKANAFGLNDTAGNVWEWTEDCSHRDYTNAPDDGSAWLESNDGNCSSRVLRGGSWDDVSLVARSANRNRYSPGIRFSSIGLRLARNAL